MVRCLALLTLVALAGPIGAQDAPISAADEYKGRLARIKETLADEHVKIGEYLNGVSMHRWVRDEFRKAIGFIPDHLEARKKLGYKSKEGEWEPDPDAALETENKKKNEEAAKIKQEYDKRTQKLGQTIGRQWAEIGNFCEKSKMKAEAEAAFRLAIEYDPTNSESRKKLGYVKQKEGPWLSKFEVSFRKQLKDNIAKAPSGAPSKEETKAEQDLGWRHEKRKSPHFLFEVSGQNQAWLAEELKHAESTYAMFHKLFDLKEDLFSQPLNLVIVVSRQLHEAYVDKYNQGDSAQKEFSKKLGGMFGFPQCELVFDPKEKIIHEPVVHLTAQFLSEHLTGGRRPWLHEGTAFHFAMQTIGQGGTYCTNMAGTGSGQGERDYRNMADWPLIVKTLIKDSKDPSMLEVFKCKEWSELSGAEAVKAWSLVDFLVTEHREKFKDFLSRVRGQKEEDDEKMLSEVFGWTLEDFDTRWRTYARASY